MQERLQKLIAAAGLASRRHAEEMIKAGEVTVNGKVITELGTKADPETDHIKVRGKLINPSLQRREKVYVLLNKPKGYLSSVSDPDGRPTVLELLPASLGRLYPGAEALKYGLVIAVTEVVRDEDIDALEAALKEVCQ